MDTQEFKKKYSAPRPLLKWFEKLGVNHKIRNLRTDLSNGFVVAEIIAQLEPGVNMNQFYDSLALQKKLQNWDILNSILQSREFVVKPEEIHEMIFMEEGTALNFMIRLYEFYTKTKITWMPPEIARPFNYLAPNITALMRKANITNIIPLHEKKAKITAQLDRHAKESKDAKSKMNLKQHIRKTRRNYLLTEISKLKLKEVKTQNTLSRNVKDDNTVLLRQYQKNNTNTTKVLSLAEMKNVLLTSIANIVEKTYKRFLLANEQHVNLLSPEIKHAFTDPHQVSDRTIEIILDACTVYAKSMTELYENNFPDFLSFFEIFISFLSRMEDKIKFRVKVCALFQALGEQFHAENDDFLVIFMENSGFKIIREMCKQRAGKRDYYAAVIKSFMPRDEDEKVKYICQMKENFGDDIRDFSALLARLVCLEDNFGTSQLYVNSLIYYANMAIKTSSPFSIVNGLKLLQLLCSVNAMKISLEVTNLELERLLKIDWWEIRAQLVQIITEVLIRINEIKLEKEQHENSKKNNHPSLQNIADDSKSLVRSAVENETEQNENAMQNSQNNEVLNEMESELNIELSSSELQKFEDNCEMFLKNMLLTMINVSENINLIKIGLIYSAKLTHYYPDFAKPYFNILMSVSNHTMSILLSEDQLDTPLPIVAGTNSYSYVQTGVHYQWNSAVIVNRMSEQILMDGAKVLSSKYAQVLKACLKTRIKSSDKDEWLLIFAKLENVLLSSLIEKSSCQDALTILKVFLNYDFICDYFSSNGNEKLYQILTKIYISNDMIDEKQCFLDLIKFLDEEMKVTEFVFEVLKRFSESNFEAFLRSNLVEYTNKLAAMRRDKLYGTGFLTTLLAF